MRTKAFSLVIVIFLLSAGWNVSHAVVTTNITASPLPPCPAPCGAGITTVTPINGTEYRITGGARPGGTGPNLFHSFGSFTIGAPDTANFFNDTGLATSNILSRVTGTNNPSYIFGTIQTTGFGNANLFLINPAGVVFGPNATLDIGRSIGTPGSFHVSTADYIRFNDPSQLDVNKPRFYADPAKSSILTSFSPDAFGFLNPNPAAITVDGSTLQVGQGQTISLVGGNRTFTREDTGEMVPAGVTMTGVTLSAPSGQINVASVASPGEILLSSLQPTPNVNGDSFTNMGTINLSQAATLDVSGGPGGTVLVRGGQFVMDASSIRNVNSGHTAAGDIAVNADTLSMTNGGQIVSSTVGAGDGGRILITATDSVSISGFDSTGTLAGVTTLLFDPNSGLPLVTSGVFTTASSSGNGGQISITAPTVTMDNGGTVASITTGNRTAVIHGCTTGNGCGGNISIDAGTVSLTSGAQILSLSGLDTTTFGISGTGDGGDITVTATDSVSIAGGRPDLFALSNISTQAFSSGHGGNIVISAPNVTLEDAGALASSSAQGAGAGGNITITASNSLSVSGFSLDFQMPSAITTSADSGGNGGAINITEGSVTVAHGGVIETKGSDAQAGNITFNVNNLSVLGGSHIKTSAIGSSSKSLSGTLTITAADTVFLSGLSASDTDSGIFTKSEGSAGISLLSIQKTGRLTLTNGARIRSDAFGGPAGAGDLKIKITANDSINISSGSKIATRALDTDIGGIDISAPIITMDHGAIQTTTVSNANAGPVTISADNLTLLNGAKITSDSEQGRGHGGPIVVTVSDSISLSGGSTVESSSLNVASGPGGSINLSAGSLISLAGTGTGLLSEAAISGQGGNITVQGNQVQLSDHATISAKSTGSGNAGNIMITARDSLAMQNHSSITTQTTQSDGGDIHVQAGRMVQLAASQITTSVQGGLGNGGNITIDPQFVILQNSQVLAQAFGGNGGNIRIVAGVFFADPNSKVDASSTRGIDGTVDIQSPVTNLSGSLSPLPTEIVQAVALLQARCAARLAGGTSGSFVVAGRDGLPLEPGGLLPSPLYIESPRSTRLAGALDIPGLRVGRTFVESTLTLAPLALGCSS